MAYVSGLANTEEIEKLRAAGWDVEKDTEPIFDDEHVMIRVFVDCDVQDLLDMTGR